MREEFIKKLKNIALNDGEIFVASNYCSPFSYVPCPQNFEYLVDNYEYVSFIKLCTKQNCFDIEGKFNIKQENTVMGNPSSLSLQMYS